jgi:flagellar biosynthesis anti-sigma factor FlgM
MVIKMNDVRTVGQAQTPSTNGAAPANVSKDQQPAKLEPAARIGLSEMAKATQANPTAAANAAANAKLDVELVKEIRQRMANGTFEIDYNKLAGNLLGDAVAAVRAGQRDAK